MGIQIKNNLYLHHLLFADDQVILAQDGEDADNMCRKLTEEYHHWGLKINASKTEYLAPNIDNDLYTEGHKIKKYNTFCYLGLILVQNGTSNVEIEKRINNGREVIGMLNSILWSSNILGKTRTLIYK
jgi:hypothetical protein